MTGHGPSLVPRAMTASQWGRWSWLSGTSTIASTHVRAACGDRSATLGVIGLEGRHLGLDGDRPHVKVRQRVRRRRGEGLVIGPLKSRYSKRDVPIPPTLADRLRALDTGPDDRVLAGHRNGPQRGQLAMGVLAPACKAAGVEWAGFHTFRHTVASRLFAEGRNVVQVQRWLGHHSASFTLDTYVHLLDNDLGEPLKAVSEDGGERRGGSIAVRFFYGRFSPARQCGSRRGGSVDLALARR